MKREPNVEQNPSFSDLPSCSFARPNLKVGERVETAGIRHQEASSY